MSDHWALEFLSRDYRKPAPCAELVVDVLREYFGIFVTIPHKPARTAPRNTLLLHQIEHLCAETTEPTEGDVVLMTALNVRRHVGIYCTIGGIGYVLHALSGAGAALHKMRELHTLNITIDGFYRCKPAT